MILSQLMISASALLSTSLVAAQGATGNSSHAAADKPNFVFILTDDQDQRMNSLEHMPNVQDLLMKEGTHYTKHYAPTALCCPARVSIWTGLHAHNHGVASVHNGPNGGWQKILKSGLNEAYLPIWLRDNGYKTYYTGKLYNGMDNDMVENRTARGWTEADLLVGGKTYQYYDPPFQHIDAKHPFNDPAKVKDFRGNYSTDQVAEYAYGYLNKAIKQDDPFFVGIAPITCHTQVGNNPDPQGPPVPSKKYKDTRPNASIPDSDNYNSPNRSGVNVVWELDRLNDAKEKKLKEHYQARTEALLSVDDIVARVVKILGDAGKLKNTYIIYSSDNGFHLGQHRLGPGKKFAFEEDINVPLIIRGPDVPKGRRTEIVTAHVDLSPTILKLAGGKKSSGKDFDGRVMPVTKADLDQRESNGKDEYSNVEFWESATYKFNGLNGTRVNSYKSLRLIGTNYDMMYAVHCRNNSHELYDMTTDSVQMKNLHPNAPHEPGHKNAFDSGTTTLSGFAIKKLLTRIDALLLVLKSCQAETCKQPWAALHQDGAVKALKDAMSSDYDDMYNNYYNNYRVKFTKCYKDGTIDKSAEGPQWPIDETHIVGINGTMGMNETVEAEGNYTNVGDDDETYSLGWENEGWWDDWE